MKISTRSYFRLWRRAAKRWRKGAFGDGSKRWLLALTAIVIVGFMIQRNDPAAGIDPAAYTPLLNTIAKGESGGNYNAHFGNPTNSAIRFTDMTVAEVLAWQDSHVKQGNISSAVGKYQIIRPTLEGLVSELGINPNEKFDEALQDSLAIALLERRGSVDYVNSRLTREQFAANIAKEWAALPKATGPDPHASYYAADGVNRSNVAVDEVLSALDSLHGSAGRQ